MPRAERTPLEAVVTDYDHVSEAAAAMATRVGTRPHAAIVLGSGLADVAARLSDAVSIAYGDLPHWPAAAVAGHEGRVSCGTLAGRPVAVLSGRCHAYEGHDMQAVAFGVRVMGLLGVAAVVLTNAAGGVSDALAPGCLMAIDDHINLMGTNPLVGPNEDRFGPRFPDMTEVYSSRLRRLADEAARAAGIRLEHGVYAALLGPAYETPAEIRYLRTIGADAVGMSTVPEAIAARHMGIEVLGISCITNRAAGLGPRALDHGEVLAAARRASGALAALVEGVVGRL